MSTQKTSTTPISITPTLSQQLPNHYEITIDGVALSLTQVVYPDHLELLHRWMHLPHVIPQWQLNKTPVELAVYFEKMLSDDHQRLYLVGINSEWVGYTEIYEGHRDRLGRYYSSEPMDLGWHLLIAEKSAYAQGYLRLVIRALSYFLFDQPGVTRIVGEPDASVKPYEVVARSLCYEPQRLIPMPEKTAMLYFCDREAFLKAYPKP